MFMIQGGGTWFTFERWCQSDIKLVLWKQYGLNPENLESI